MDNWTKLVEENEALLGRHFIDESDDKKYYFFGLVHGDDDYYYGMWGDNLKLLSCAIDLEGHGFKEIQ
jgi:hypothetical protein